MSCEDTVVISHGARLSRLRDHRRHQ